MPHHVTQRGIRKKNVFFKELDYRIYLELARERRKKARVGIWAYCLMPNHIHMVVVPEEESSLSRFFGPLHCRYAIKVNAVHGWQGHLWQQRFYSTVMDETHTIAAMRYVELNPVRAGLCARPEDWPWSSIHAHLDKREDPLVDSEATGKMVSNWREYINGINPAEEQDALRNHTRTGRPVGAREFLQGLEERLGRQLKRKHHH
jgi:putative transposase